MKMFHVLRLAVAAVSLTAVAVRADTLYVQAQSPTLDFWSSVPNWYVMDVLGHLAHSRRLANEQIQVIAAALDGGSKTLGRC